MRIKRLIYNQLAKSLNGANGDLEAMYYVMQGFYPGTNKPLMKKTLSDPDDLRSIIITEATLEDQKFWVARNRFNADTRIAGSTKFTSVHNVDKPLKAFKWSERKLKEDNDTIAVEVNELDVLAAPTKTKSELLSRTVSYDFTSIPIKLKEAEPHEDWYTNIYHDLIDAIFYQLQNIHTGNGSTLSLSFGEIVAACRQHIRVSEDFITGHSDMPVLQAQMNTIGHSLSIANTIQDLQDIAMNITTERLPLLRRNWANG